MERRGQILIVAAILISITVFSIATAVHRAALSYYWAKREAYADLVRCLEQDFERILTRILARATQGYNSSLQTPSPLQNFDLWRAWAFEEYSHWVKTAVAAYSSMGLRLEAELQAERELRGRKVAVVEYEYESGGKRRVVALEYGLPEATISNLLQCYWYSPQSISAIYSALRIDAVGEGFYGWRESKLVALNLTIEAIRLDKIEKRGREVPRVYLEFSLLDESGAPVVVDEHRVSISYFDPTADISEGECPWVRAEFSLEYEGMGKYVAIYEVEGVDYEEFVHYAPYAVVWAIDQRGILVEAVSYTGFELVLEDTSGIADSSRELGGLVYNLEYGINGTLSWLQHRLGAGAHLPPIPPVPVKQLRIMATEEGPDSELVEIPFQVETWERPFDGWSGSVVGERPVSFAVFAGRLNQSHKIVFNVDFSKSRRQRLRIGWESKVEERAPEYLLQVRLEENSYRVSNGVFEIVLAGVSGYTVARLYPTGIEGAGELEFYSMGWNWCLVEGCCDWSPDSKAYGGWKIGYGPVRAFAFRDGTEVWKDSLCCARGEEGAVVGDELRHSSLVLVPYGTNYSLVYGRGEWLSDTTTKRIMYMFAYTYWPSAPEGKARYWAYLSSEGSVRTGEYDYEKGTQACFRDYSYWAAVYDMGSGPKWGAALFLTEEALRSVELFPGEDEDRISIMTYLWASAAHVGYLPLHSREWYSEGDFKEHNEEDFVIAGGTEFFFKVALWVFRYPYEGVSPVSIFGEFYKMFISTPSVVAVEVGECSLYMD